MFDEIWQHTELFGLIRYECSENQISAELDQRLEEDKYIILKPDEYYNTIKFASPLPSVDCLIIVKCDSNQGYDFYLVELRNTKSPSGFDVENIISKFQTVIEDFLSNRFGNIFLNSIYVINNLYLFFISNPYRFGNMTREEYDEIIKANAFRFKTIQLLKPLKFKGKVALIQHKLPLLIRINPC
jgi:hypothetical protein